MRIACFFSEAAPARQPESNMQARAMQAAETIFRSHFFLFLCFFITNRLLLNGIKHFLEFRAAQVFFPDIIALQHRCLFRFLIGQNLHGTPDA